MKYEFSQKLNKENYLAFYKYHVTKNFLSPSRIVITAIFFLVLFSGVLYGQPNMTYVGLGLVVIVGVMYYRILKSGYKIYDKDPETFDYSFILDETACSFSTKDGKSTKMWSEFVKKHETDEFLFIFTKQNRGLMFVKNLCEVEVINFINEKVKVTSKFNPIRKK